LIISTIGGKRVGDTRCFAVELAPLEIEALGQQSTLPNEQQPSRSVLALRIRRDEARGLERPELAQVDAANGVRSADEACRLFAAR
jgi:hypothetical protein